MDAPIFVVGTPRSGTTLVAKILGRHPRLFMPGETHFFDDIYALRGKLGDPSDPEDMKRIAARLRDHYRRYWEPDDQARIDRIISERPDIWHEWTASCKTYQDVFFGFMELQMRWEGKYRWGNNVPRDIFNLREILSFAPNAKFIVCVRDVRDFLYSYRDKWKATSEEHVERLRNLYHPVVTTLLWKSTVSRVLHVHEWVPLENFIIVRYVDLVTEPEPVVRQICQTVGEDFEAGMLDVNGHNSSHQGNSSGIYSTSVGAWRGNLPETDVVIAQQLAGAEMRALGYELSDVKAGSSSMLKAYLKAPAALWRGLESNKNLRGPLVPYLMKRFNSLIGK